MKTLPHLHLFTRLLPCLLLLSVILFTLFSTVSAAAQGDTKAAARVHFQKGVAAFNERRYAEASKEFDIAYELSPAYVVLYNIGQVNVALGNSVAAVDAFDEYLKQGASSIPSTRRQEVQTEIEEQRGLIGSLTIVTHPEPAEVRIDGKLVGATPLLKAVRVNAGQHSVQALLPDCAPQIRELDVGGGTELTLEFTFEPAAPAVAAQVAPQPVTEPGPPVQAAPTTVKAAAHAAAAPKPAPQEAESSSFNWLRATGIVVALCGVATMTVGGLQALRGVNQAKDASETLAQTKTPAAYDAQLPAFNEAKRKTEKGWVIAGIGAGGTLGGVLLAVLAPDTSKSALGYTPWFTANSGGLTLNGAW